jgi:hypothetical protein
MIQDSKHNKNDTPSSEISDPDDEPEDLTRRPHFKKPSYLSPANP